MSADAWRVCPKCKAASAAAHTEKRKKILDAYGKGSAEEFLEGVKAVSKPAELQETLREDYEIGTYTDGIFSVSYSGFCKTCNFSFEFKHEQEI